MPNPNNMEAVVHRLTHRRFPVVPHASACLHRGGVSSPDSPTTAINRLDSTTRGSAASSAPSWMTPTNSRRRCRNRTKAVRLRSIDARSVSASVPSAKALKSGHPERESSKFPSWLSSLAIQYSLSIHPRFNAFKIVLTSAAAAAKRADTTDTGLACWISMTLLLALRGSRRDKGQEEGGRMAIRRGSTTAQPQGWSVRPDSFDGLSPRAQASHSQESRFVTAHEPGG